MNSKITTSLKVVFALTAIFVLASCRKDKDPEPEAQPVTEGVFVLNEGSWGGNNSSLTYYDFNSKSATANIYASANSGAKLGDLGQDVKVYGSKMYILVGGSNTVEVVNNKTAKTIKTITLTNASPRYFATANGKVFISAYDDKVYVLDTASLTVQKSIPVGKDPEHMAVIGNKLYVANSGGLEATFDNTISVIDLTTLQEVSKITVDINLSQIKADQYGDLYVISRGKSWATPAIPSILYVVNPTTGTIKKKFSFEATDFAINGDLAYVYSFSYITYQPLYKVINVKDETIVSENFITDGTASSITLPYGIGVDPVSGDVYISDAKDFANAGTVYCYDKAGKKKFSFNAGIAPSGFSFFVK